LGGALVLAAAGFCVAGQHGCRKRTRRNSLSPPHSFHFSCIPDFRHPSRRAGPRRAAAEYRTQFDRSNAQVDQRLSRQARARRPSCAPATGQIELGIPCVIGGAAYSAGLQYISH
jgi:hypothetical protein